MIDKFKIPLVLFLLGTLFTIVGALFKITHWPFANVLLIVGMLTEAFAIIALIVILVKKSK